LKLSDFSKLTTPDIASGVFFPSRYTEVSLGLVPIRRPSGGISKFKPWLESATKVANLSPKGSPFGVTLSGFCLP
jgi:hypothetical protein